jgi:hypothetical protein
MDIERRHVHVRVLRVKHRCHRAQPVLDDRTHVQRSRIVPDNRRRRLERHTENPQLLVRHLVHDRLGQANRAIDRRPHRAE